MAKNDGWRPGTDDPPASEVINGLVDRLVREQEQRRAAERRAAMAEDWAWGRAPEAPWWVFPAAVVALVFAGSWLMAWAFGELVRWEAFWTDVLTLIMTLAALALGAVWCWRWCLSKLKL